MRIALVSIKGIKHKVTKQLHGVMSLTITDAEADSLTYLKLYGGTEQKSKNMLNPAEIGQIVVDGEGTQRYGWIISVPAGTYTSSIQTGYCYINTLINGEYGTAFRTMSGTPETFTLSNAGDILLYVGAGVNANTLLSRQPQLEEGSEATPYVPYSGTPTPTAPVDIKSNNGAIKYGITSKNLLDMSSDNIVLRKYIDNNGAILDSTYNFYNSKYIPVEGGETYTWSTSISANYISIMEYDSNKTFIKRTLFGASGAPAGTSGQITLENNTAYILLGSNIDTNTATMEKIQAINRQIEKGNTATEYVPYTEGIDCAGPIETVEDSLGNTATAEMLLKLGDYQDVQDVISGSVTRKVGVKVLDGTENGRTKSNLAVGNTSLFSDKVKAKGVMYCSHFTYNSNNTSAIPDMCFGCASISTNIYFRYDAVSTTVEDFKQRLANEYAAGTPVIIVYPLATETTESVTPQTINVRSGNNTIEITQAGLDDLELEIEYNGDPL